MFTIHVAQSSSYSKHTFRLLQYFSSPSMARDGKRMVRVFVAVYLAPIFVVHLISFRRLSLYTLFKQKSSRITHIGMMMMMRSLIFFLRVISIRRTFASCLLYDQKIKHFFSLVCLIICVSPSNDNGLVSVFFLIWHIVTVKFPACYRALDCTTIRGAGKSVHALSWNIHCVNECPLTCW